MPKPTRAEKLAAGLTALGYVEVEGRSGRYRTFKSGDASASLKFIGRAGALRSGRSVSDSVSLGSGVTYQRVLRVGEEALRKERGR